MKSTPLNFEPMKHLGLILHLKPWKTDLKCWEHEETRIVRANKSRFEKCCNEDPLCFLIKSHLRLRHSWNLFKLWSQITTLERAIPELWVLLYTCCGVFGTEWSGSSKISTWYLFPILRSTLFHFIAYTITTMTNVTLI